MSTRQWLSICVVLVTAATLLLVIYRITNKPPSVDWSPMQQETPVDLDDVNSNLGPPQGKETTFEDALNSIKEETLKEDLYYLASDELEGRMSGKQGNRTAAEFIKQKFESFGLKTAYDRLPIRRSNPGPKNETGDDFTQNIYAWIEGTDPLLKDEIVVIGAHMDHIGYGPSMSRAPRQREVHNGADDNGSGTVALLEIAEAFSMLKYKVKRTVVFQAYSAEEMGLIGSRHYCDNPIFPLGNPDIKKHIFMLNMDMVGWLDNGQYLAFFNSGDSSPDVGKIIRDLGGKYSFAGGITSRGTSGSDHASFYNKRVPIAFLHTGLHRHYHTPTDDPDLINYSGLASVTAYAFELAWTVVQSEQRPAFNHEGFQVMAYTHDHGHPEVPFERQ
jgi:hypothetical protein